MEIERKYLLTELPFQLDGFQKHQIEQSYVSTDPVIRIRKIDSKHVLTCKGSGRMAREEWELELTKAQYERLSKKAETAVLKKSRYLIPLENELTAELDVYEAPAGLVDLFTVEVEFDSIEEAMSFEPPIWFGRDVTEVAGYSNNALILHGRPE